MTGKPKCVGVVLGMRRNRFTKGWFQAAEPRRCRNDARPRQDTCAAHSETRNTIYNTPGVED